jgi:hypothetical protein
MADSTSCTTELSAVYDPKGNVLSYRPDLKTRFLHHLSPDGILKSLSRLHKTG